MNDTIFVRGEMGKIAQSDIKYTNVKSKYGSDVTVAYASKKSDNHLPTVLVVGKCGNSIHVHTWTIGADDGPRPNPPTAEELQKQLDTLRQTVADEAAWKESVNTAVQKLT